MLDRDKIDKASDIEFAKAVVQNIPQQGTSHIGLVLGAAYAAARIIKGVRKDR